jgi:geranylgeranyl pyrophosphate synthase
MAALLASADELRTRAFATKLSRTGALGAARRVAEEARDRSLAALEQVPESPTRELLGQVARALLARKR